MTDIFAGSIFMIFWIFILVMVVLFLAKYRREILDWVTKPPCQDSEMADFDTLRDMGIEEKEAIEKIRHFRIHRKEIKRAISKDSETETGG